MKENREMSTFIFFARKVSRILRKVLCSFFTQHKIIFYVDLCCEWRDDSNLAIIYRSM